MLFSTFCFSGTGNTKWAAEKLAEIISGKGQTAVTHSIDRNSGSDDASITEILEKSDFIGFAYPIYGADIPPIMRTHIAWVNELAEKAGISKKPVYFLSTFGYANAFGPFETAKLLSRKCFRMTAYINVRMCNNVSTYKLKSKPVSPDELRGRMLRAEAGMERAVDDLISGRKHIEGIGPYLLPGFIIRRAAGPKLRSSNRELSVDEGRCVRCLRCVNGCPTGAIGYAGGRFEFTHDCTGCMRCYNNCPEAAVMVGGVYTDPSDYPRYRGPENYLAGINY